MKLRARSPARRDEHRIQHKIEQRPLRARRIVDRNARLDPAAATELHQFPFNLKKPRSLQSTLGNSSNKGQRHAQLRDHSIEKSAWLPAMQRLSQHHARFQSVSLIRYIRGVGFIFLSGAMRTRTHQKSVKEYDGDAAL
jgi:hypothetical protein